MSLSICIFQCNYHQRLMEELIRDTAFGHLVRLLSKGRVLQYAEDRDPSLWRQYLSDANTRSMAHHGDSDQLSDKERPAQSSEESSRTRAGSEQHFNPTGQPVDQEKGKNSNVVDWFDENDPEVGSCRVCRRPEELG